MTSPMPSPKLSTRHSSLKTASLKTTSLRIGLMLGVAALGLSACNRDKDVSEPAKPVKAPAVVTQADAAAPFAFDSANTYATVKLALPQAVKPWPDLHARLYSTAVRDLRQFTEGAQSDKTEA